MRAALLAVLLLATTATGCGNDYTVSLYVQSDPPIDVQLATDRVTMTEGIAVGVLARAFDDGEIEDEDEAVELLSQNSGVLDVRPGINPNEFVLIARSPGRTTIDAFVDDEAATPIEIVVTAQGAVP